MFSLYIATEESALHFCTGRTWGTLQLFRPLSRTQLLNEWCERLSIRLGRLMIHSGMPNSFWSLVYQLAALIRIGSIEYPSRNVMTSEKVLSCTPSLSFHSYRLSCTGAIELKETVVIFEAFKSSEEKNLAQNFISCTKTSSTRNLFRSFHLALKKIEKTIQSSISFFWHTNGNILRRSCLTS
jgi:hypothetical protein